MNRDVQPGQSRRRTESPRDELPRGSNMQQACTLATELGCNALALRHALPVASESRWSDLLAVLIETDPAPMLAVLKMDQSPTDLRARREVVVSSSDRIDLVIEGSGRTLAVIEVKVLAGLGRRQLERYAAAVPGADRYVLLVPKRLPVHISSAPAWHAVTWEAVLMAYQKSTKPLGCPDCMRLA